MKGKERKNRSQIVIVAILLASVPLLILPASATTVSISDVFAEPGENAVTQIRIDNVTNLGVADINFTFDSSVVHIVSVNNSDFEFLWPVINNSAGIARIGGIDYGDGLNGNVSFAEVTLKAVGNRDETSALNLSINVLKEAGAIETPIPASVDNGTAVLNLPPVAIARSMHRYNNVGSRYSCNATFNGSASYDPDSDGITNYEWNLGDDNFSTGETVEHAYASCKWNGTGYEPFNVCLTVLDNGSLENTVIMPVNVYIAGDATGDGRVNILDAVIVGREWGEKCASGDCCWEGQDRGDRGDLNNDCKVNILDAVIIGANWGHVAW